MRKGTEQWYNEERLQRLLALEFAKPFCEQHGYSFEKLKKQRFLFCNCTAGFAQPSGVKPNGLCNDMDTMPIPTLAIRLEGDRLTIEAFEAAEKYLRE